MRPWLRLSAVVLIEIIPNGLRASPLVSGAGRPQPRANLPQGDPPTPVNPSLSSSLHPRLAHNDEWTRSQDTGRQYWQTLEGRVSENPIRNDPPPFNFMQDQQHWKVDLSEVREYPVRHACAPNGLFDVIDYLESGGSRPSGTTKICSPGYWKWDDYRIDPWKKFWCQQMTSPVAGALIGTQMVRQAPDGTRPPFSWEQMALRNWEGNLHQPQRAQALRFTAQLNITEAATISVIQDIMSNMAPNIMNTEASRARCSWLAQQGIRWPDRKRTDEKARLNESSVPDILSVNDSCPLPPLQHSKRMNVSTLSDSVVHVAKLEEISKLMNSSGLTYASKLGNASRPANNIAEVSELAPVLRLLNVSELAYLSNLANISRLTEGVANASKVESVSKLLNALESTNVSKSANVSRLTDSVTNATKMESVSKLLNASGIANLLKSGKAYKLTNTATEAGKVSGVSSKSRRAAMVGEDGSNQDSSDENMAPLSNAKTWRFSPQDADGNFFALLGTVEGGEAVHLISKWPLDFSTRRSYNEVRKVKKIQYIWLQQYPRSRQSADLTSNFEINNHSPQYAYDLGFTYTDVEYWPRSNRRSTYQKMIW